MIGDKPLDQRSIGEVAPVMMPSRPHSVRDRRADAQGRSDDPADHLFARPDLRLGAIYLQGLRALESLARLNTRVAPLDEETVAQLEQGGQQAVVERFDARRGCTRSRR